MAKKQKNDWVDNNGLKLIIALFIVMLLVVALSWLKTGSGTAKKYSLNKAQIAEAKELLQKEVAITKEFKANLEKKDLSGKSWINNLNPADKQQLASKLSEGSRAHGLLLASVPDQRQKSLALSASADGVTCAYAWAAWSEFEEFVLDFETWDTISVDQLIYGMMLIKVLRQCSDEKSLGQNLTAPEGVVFLTLDFWQEGSKLIFMNLQDLLNLLKEETSKAFVIDEQADVKLVILNAEEYEKLLMRKLAQQVKNIEEINQEIIKAQLDEPPSVPTPLKSALDKRAQELFRSKPGPSNFQPDLRSEVIDPSFDFEAPKRDIDEI